MLLHEHHLPPIAWSSPEHLCEVISYYQQLFYDLVALASRKNKWQIEKEIMNSFNVETARIDSLLSRHLAKTMGMYLA